MCSRPFETCSLPTLTHCYPSRLCLLYRFSQSSIRPVGFVARVPEAPFLAPTLVVYLAILSCVHGFLIKFSLSVPELQRWALSACSRFIGVERWAFAIS